MDRFKHLIGGKLPFNDFTIFKLAMIAWASGAPKILIYPNEQIGVIDRNVFSKFFWGV